MRREHDDPHAAVLLAGIAGLALAHPDVPRERVARLVYVSDEQLAASAPERDDRAKLAVDFARERLEGIDRRSGARTRVLFLSTRNDGISQMAEAFVEAWGTGIDAQSAGLSPVGIVLRSVEDAMDEAGVPLTTAFPKPLTDEVLAGADLVVTMLCEAPPLRADQRTEDWDFDDPAGLSTPEVRRLRDRLALRVRELLAALD